jgi:hypothetical protein
VKKVIIILCLFSNLHSIAQEKTKQFSEEVGFTASTTAAYRINGTDTSLKNALTLAPFFRIMHKSGLGLNYTANTLASGAGKKFFMHTASAFYESYDKPVNLNFSYTHFFFTNNSAIPYTPITNELYGYIAYKKLWIAPVASASIGFGKDENKQTQSVFNLSTGVTHNFTFSSQTIKEATISPSILLNGGSNEFYSFLKTVRNFTQSTGTKGFLTSHGLGHGNSKGNGNGNAGNTPTTTTTESATNKFMVNNVELNIYSSFTFGHFEIIPDGSLYVPLISNSQVSAYWQIKFGYNFGR